MNQVYVTIDNIPLEKILPGEFSQVLTTVISSLSKANCNFNERKIIEVFEDKLATDLIWAFYYRVPVFDLNNEIFNTPYFQSRKSSGKNYADQLNLSIGVWDRHPIKGFSNPSDWWIQQLTEIAQLEQMMIFTEHETSLKKKKLISKFRKDINLLEGKQGKQKGLKERQQKRIDTMPSALIEFKRLLSLSIKFADLSTPSGKNFVEQYWLPFLSSARAYVRDMDRGTPGLDKKIKTQFLWSNNGSIYCTSPRQPLKIEFA